MSCFFILFVGLGDVMVKKIGVVIINCQNGDLTGFYLSKLMIVIVTIYCTRVHNGINIYSFLFYL